MSDFNERTALNYKLRQAAQETKRKAQEAMDRRLLRAINKAHRKSVTIVAVSSALAGAALVAGVAALTYLVA